MSMEIKGNLPDYGVRKQNYSNYTANYVDTAKKPDNKAAYYRVTVAELR